MAIEKASLDLVHVEDLIPAALPDQLPLGEGSHLFERIHGKDRYRVIDYLAELSRGNREYDLSEIA